MKINILFLFFIISLISCKEEVSGLKQRIYFEKHYINMAWFPQSTGYLIDSLGNVLKFHWVEVSHIWYDPDSTGYVSSIDMNKNISYCQTDSFHINPDTLNLYISKIYEASKGTITSPEHVAADMGTTTYSAFIYDAKTRRYKQVLIKTVGDISTINLSPEAEQIYQWMIRTGN